MKMDVIRTILAAIVLALLTYLLGFALFSIFSTLGPFWSILLLFVVYMFVVGALWQPAHRNQYIVTQRVA